MVALGSQKPELVKKYSQKLQQFQNQQHFNVFAKYSWGHNGSLQTRENHNETSKFFQGFPKFLS